MAAGLLSSVTDLLTAHTGTTGPHLDAVCTVHGGVDDVDQEAADIDEDDHLKAVGAHKDAHAVWDRLNPIERDGFVSILRILMSAPGLAAEFLALADRQHQTEDGR